MSLEIIQTGPRTFYLKFDSEFLRYDSIEQYEQEYSKLVTELYSKAQSMDLEAKIKSQYKVLTQYYLTFKSKHDAVAFKLRWC